MAAPKKSMRTPKLKRKVKTRSKSVTSVPDKILPVVGVGASAGRLKAFGREGILLGLKDNTGERKTP
jgi:hypothetical protein